jgi:hypothetical protein
MCQHEPSCPPAEAIDHDAARVIASYPEQGWSLLCNGVIVFDDTGELMPDGRCVEPCRGPAPHTPVTCETRPDTAETAAPPAPMPVAA